MYAKCRMGLTLTRFNFNIKNNSDLIELPKPALYDSSALNCYTMESSCKIAGKFDTYAKRKSITKS